MEVSVVIVNMRTPSCSARLRLGRVCESVDMQDIIMVCAWSTRSAISSVANSICTFSFSTAGELVDFIVGYPTEAAVRITTVSSSEDRALVVTTKIY